MELTIPNQFSAMSNTFVAKTEQLNDKLKRITFERTILMSSYLLVWVVGVFDIAERVLHTSSSNSVVLRAVTAKGKASQVCIRFWLLIGVG